MRERVVLVEESVCSLWYYPKEKIVHHELRAFVHGARFRNLLDKGLDAFKQHGACKWLSDDRGNNALSQDDAEWAMSDWAPRVIAAGWKYWAVVMPEKVMGQINMKRWIKEYSDRGVTVQHFTDPNLAFEWLARL
jgi:hypothetical protein